VAAKRTGRRGFGIELDPLYCDVTLRRLRSVCGLEAILESTGQSFEDLATRRREEPAPAEA
jgi:DNA modification methylase